MVKLHFVAGGLDVYIVHPATSAHVPNSRPQPVKPRRLCDLHADRDHVAVYLYGLAFITTDAAANRFYFDYAMIPARISAGQNYPSLVTSIFIHAGFMHLAGNMLVSVDFRDNMEDEMGTWPVSDLLSR